MKHTLKTIFKYISLFLAVLTVLSCMSVATLAVAAPKLTQVKSLKAQNIDDDEINLKWSSVKGAKGYQIYQYNTKTKKYVKIGVTSKTAYEVDDLKEATSYKFKVRAYTKSGSKYYYGDYSKVLTSATTPDEVEGLKVSSKGKTSLTLKWNKVTRAEGYGVFVYDSAKGKYVRKAQVTTNSVKLTGLKEGTTYKIKVRAFIKVGDTYYCGDYSDVLSAKTSGSSSSGSSTSKSYIGTTKATNIALEHAGLSKSSVRELECHLDKENGTYVYEIEFEYKNYDYEYEVNAYTGKILSVEKDKD